MPWHRGHLQRHELRALEDAIAHGLFDVVVARPGTATAVLLVVRCISMISSARSRTGGRPAAAEHAAVNKRLL
jgi:predicted methyltransferase MtxX (methanogen marker protein 4)